MENDNTIIKWDLFIPINIIVWRVLILLDLSLILRLTTSSR